MYDNPKDFTQLKNMKMQFSYASPLITLTPFLPWQNILPPNHRKNLTEKLQKAHATYTSFLFISPIVKENYVTLP